MSNQVSTKQLFLDIIQSSTDVALQAEALGSNYKSFAEKVAVLALRLENFLELSEGAKQEEKRTPLVEVQDNSVKVHPDITRLIQGQPFTPLMKTYNLKDLKSYSFIQVLKTTDEFITYIKVKDSRGSIHHQKFEFLKLDSDIIFEAGNYYIIQEKALTKKRGGPAIWNWAQEIASKSKAENQANRLAAVFAKAKCDGVPY